MRCLLIHFLVLIRRSYNFFLNMFNLFILITEVNMLFCLKMLNGIESFSFIKKIIFKIEPTEIG